MKALLHMLSWPLGQNSQKDAFNIHINTSDLHDKNISLQVLIVLDNYDICYTDSTLFNVSVIMCSSCYLLVFRRNEKTSVKQSMKRKVCSNLADLPPGRGI